MVLWQADMPHKIQFISAAPLTWRSHWVISERATWVKYPLSTKSLCQLCLFNFFLGNPVSTLSQSRTPQHLKQVTRLKKWALTKYSLHRLPYQLSQPQHQLSKLHLQLSKHQPSGHLLLFLDQLVKLHPGSQYLHLAVNMKWCMQARIVNCQNWWNMLLVQKRNFRFYLRVRWWNLNATKMCKFLMLKYSLCEHAVSNLYNNGWHLHTDHILYMCSAMCLPCKKVDCHYYSIPIWPEVSNYNMLYSPIYRGSWRSNSPLPDLNMEVESTQEAVKDSASTGMLIPHLQKF